MRIALNAQKLLTAQSYHAAGITRYSHHLLAELRQAPGAHHLTAFTPRMVDSPALAPTSRFRVIATGAATERPAIRILWEQLALPARLAGRFDLLHGLAFAVPLAWRGRTVVTILDLSFLRFPHMFNRANRLYLTLSARLAARRADRILTISEHGRREVVELLGIPANRVVTTYCAADARFRPLPAAEVEAFRRAKGLPDRFILYLGTLEPRKNLPTLLQAYARLRKEWPLAPELVLAGAPGWLYNEVFDAIRRLGLERRVRTPGFVAGEEQALWYNAAAVLAYPSVYEGFGLPPLEAMACGTPVVASDAASLPEVVGEAGVLISPLDVRAWADALRRTLEDEQLRATLREAGPARAARFSWARMARETLRCYEELAS